MAETPAHSSAATTGWEYRVVHIDVASKSPPRPPDASEASERLGGALSPEFIAREFPELYRRQPSLPQQETQMRSYEKVRHKGQNEKQL